MKRTEEKIKAINRTIEVLKKEKEQNMVHSWEVSKCPLCDHYMRGHVDFSGCRNCPMTLIKLSFRAKLKYRAGAAYCSCVIRTYDINTKDSAGVDFLIGLMEALKRELYGMMLK